MNDLYKKAADAINSADALLIGAGAGMGVDSGLPDFRGKQGFWREYPVIEKLGVRFEEMANPRWFSENPKLAWAFYGHRYNLYKKTVPHKGFLHLLKIGSSMKNGYFVYTSNVDGHFQKAGFDNHKIYEIHGSINHLQCKDGCTNHIWDVDFENIDINEDTFEAVGNFPKCKHCNSIARPNILMFGDWGWISNRSNIQSQSYHQWIKDLNRKNAKLVILEFGAGKAVPSVRMNSNKIVGELNAKLIRINPRDYDVRGGQIGISAGALETMDKIVELL